MPDYEIRPLQLRILEILLAVDKVCREHGLRYYLWAGTLLGAIRHKGFIPWDDDVDICMPRADYDTLMAHAKEWLPAPYEAMSAETNGKYPGSFGKIIDSSTTLIERAHYAYLSGIYIDVFPIDGVPQSAWRRRLHFMRFEFYKRIVYFLHRDPYKHGRGPSSWLPLLCRKCFTHEGVQQKLRRLMLKYNYEDAQLVADYDDGLKGVFDKSLLGEPTPVSFEGHELKGVAQYDRYLTQKYGDYMQIPAANQQRQHNFYYLDYNQPYRAYKDQRNFRL